MKYILGSKSLFFL